MQAPVAVKKTLLSLCLFTLFSTAAMADAGSQGGMIHFMGEIVEPPCDVNHAGQDFSLTCSDEGKMNTRHFSLQALNNAPQYFSQIASVNIQYFDKQKTIAVMNIDYR